MAIRELGEGEGVAGERWLVGERPPARSPAAEEVEDALVVSWLLWVGAAP